VALFELTNQTLVQVPETRFDSEVLKSKDLQRLLRQDISVLSGDLKVLAQEYGDWEDSNLRIDLLCLDKEPTWLSFRSRALLTQVISICRLSAARL
jgi:hypothetical protein